MNWFGLLRLHKMVIGESLIAPQTPKPEPVGSSLVHRDPHFGAIPGSLLKQEVLPEK